jgi:hypothetical protein
MKKFLILFLALLDVSASQAAGNNRVERRLAFGFPDPFQIGVEADCRRLGGLAFQQTIQQRGLSEGRINNRRRTKKIKVATSCSTPELCKGLPSVLLTW